MKIAGHESEWKEILVTVEVVYIFGSFKLMCSLVILLYSSQYELILVVSMLSSLLRTFIVREICLGHD